MLTAVFLEAIKLNEKGLFELSEEALTYTSGYFYERKTKNFKY